MLVQRRYYVKLVAKRLNQQKLGEITQLDRRILPDIDVTTAEMHGKTR